MRKKNDILLKSAFEETFPDLLRFFFEDADCIFDMERGFEFLDKELAELFPDPEKKGGSRFVDLLAKIFTKDGTEKWMLVHIEIQSAHDPQFGQRMFQYFYRIFDKYAVPITALAVFTGDQDHLNELHYQYQFLGTSVRYSFNSYQIFDHSEEQLLAMDNRFALVVLAAQKVALADKVSQRQLAEQRLLIAKAMIESKRYDEGKIKRFLYFLKTFIYIDDRKINSTFDKQIATITGSNTTMGIIETIQMLTREEALEEGAAKTQKAIIANLLRQTAFSPAQIAELAEVEVDFVLEIKAELKK